MKNFPMFLNLADRPVFVVGGGEQAAQKARLMMKTEADLKFLAPELEPELSNAVDEGKAVHVRPEGSAPFEDAALVFVATGCKGADAAWHGVAKSQGALVNVVDYPELCDAVTPSIVDRDPVVIAIGTEGTAPVLGRQLKTRIEEMLHPRLGSYAALAGRLRSQVARYVPRVERRSFWKWVFSAEPWLAFTAGHEDDAARMIKSAIRTGEKGDSAGHLCVVLGAQESGLVPLRVVQRLQEADVVFVEREVPEDVLELARRDAERVWVGRPEHGDMPRRTVPAAIAAEAKELRTVFLSARTDPLSLPLNAGWPDRFEEIHCGKSIVERASRTQGNVYYLSAPAI